MKRSARQPEKERQHHDRKRDRPALHRLRLSGKNITVHGTPGNGLGQYLNGSTLEVFGNAPGGGRRHDERGRHHHPRQRRRRLRQRHGAARPHLHRGRLRLPRRHPHEGQSGALPVVVIGGKAGSFLGEYQAGGLILVLGIGQNGAYPVNQFLRKSGMHGGKIVLRCDKAPTGFPLRSS